MGDYTDASPFLECQAILAAQERDSEGLRAVLRKMLPGELHQLRLAGSYLIGAAADAIAERDHAHAEDL